MKGKSDARWTRSAGRGRQAWEKTRWARSLCRGWYFTPGCGIAVDLNVVISKTLGEKDEAVVKKAASAAMFLAASFQGLGQSTGSMLLTLTRQAAQPLLLVLAVTPSRNLNLAWWAFAVSELLTIPLSVEMWRQISRKALPAVIEAVSAS